MKTISFNEKMHRDSIKRYAEDRYYEIEKFIVENVYPLFNYTTQRTYSFFLEYQYFFNSTTCTKTLKEISSHIHLSERTVRRAIINLSKRKILETKKNIGAATTFTLKRPWLEDPELMKEINDRIESLPPLSAEELSSNCSAVEDLPNAETKQLLDNNYTSNEHEPYSNQNKFSDNIDLNNYPLSREEIINKNKWMELLKKQMDENKRLNIFIEKLINENASLIKTVRDVFSELISLKTEKLVLLNTNDDTKKQKS